jgi:hypothetical protein
VEGLFSEVAPSPWSWYLGDDRSGGELIYHTQSSATYDATYPEECFATEAAAQAAGYRAARD